MTIAMVQLLSKRLLGFLALSVFLNKILYRFIIIQVRDELFSPFFHMLVKSLGIKVRMDFVELVCGVTKSIVADSFVDWVLAYLYLHGVIMELCIDTI